MANCVHIKVTKKQIQIVANNAHIQTCMRVLTCTVHSCKVYTVLEIGGPAWSKGESAHGKSCHDNQHALMLTTSYSMDGFFFKIGFSSSHNLFKSVYPYWQSI